MALSNGRLTPHYNVLPIPQTLTLPIQAAVTIYAGALVSWDGTGVRPARATATDLVLGRARTSYDNASGALAAANMDVELGCFGWTISATAADALTNADIGKPVYASDDFTICKRSLGSRPCVGIFLKVDPVTGYGFVVPSIINTAISAVPGDSVNPYVRCVASANIDLTTALVAGQTIDGITLVAGDRVLVAKQTTAADSGVYIATAAGAASLAPDYASGPIMSGAVFHASVGTRWANSSWKVTAAAVANGAITVGTTDPAMYPKMNKGVGAVGTVVADAFIMATSSPLSAIDQTAAAALKAVLVAGRGDGTITWTGTGTDVVLYAVHNW